MSRGGAGPAESLPLLPLRAGETPPDRVRCVRTFALGAIIPKGEPLELNVRGERGAMRG
jgi:hypothetical protein